MQTDLAPFIRETPEGREADSILRACVHCGFCTATCPTYQLLGDELDGPRGRIYLIKSLLERGEAGAPTQLHLDRCLTCRACETTCPSGVRYGRLLEIGREVVEARVPRRPADRVVRRLLRMVLPRPALFSPLYRVGARLRPVLPSVLADKVAVARPAGEWPAPRHRRRMVVLDGCVQRAMAPSINAAAARVLDRLGISLVRLPTAGCCGALSLHLGAVAEARAMMRALVDRLLPLLDGGVEAVVSTASGCGVTIREYGTVLATDPDYAERGRRLAERTRDLAEVVTAAGAGIPALGEGRAVAVHAPCTLAHGLRLRGVVETLLEGAGYRLLPVRDGHLCCGSAGTYSVLQAGLSRRLRDAKLAALQEGGPQWVVSSNIGCLAHLEPAARVPVLHWVELLDRHWPDPGR